MTYVFLFGSLVGLIAGLLICYWKQVTTVVQNRDKISSIAGLYDSINNVRTSF